MLTFVPKYNLSAKVSIFSMVRGIIYRYLSPSGKSYIGQTTNEKLRRRSWMSDKYHYAGAKIVEPEPSMVVAHSYMKY